MHKKQTCIITSSDVIKGGHFDASFWAANQPIGSDTCTTFSECKYFSLKLYSHEKLDCIRISHVTCDVTRISFQQSSQYSHKWGEVTLQVRIPKFLFKYPNSNMGRRLANCYLWTEGGPRKQVTYGEVVWNPGAQIVVWSVMYIQLKQTSQILAVGFNQVVPKWPQPDYV